MPRLIGHLFLFYVSVFYDTTKDLSLFKRGIPAPQHIFFSLRSHIPIFRSLAASPCSTYHSGISAGSILKSKGSTFVIFILLLPSEIFHTVFKEALYLCSYSLFLLRNINDVTRLDLDVLDL